MTNLMTPKLLLALALVGAMHAGEPAAPDKTYAAPTSLATSAGVISALAFTRDVTFTGPGADESSWLVVHCDPNCHGYEDAYAPAKVKLTVTREPTVIRKADGSWEITFAGKQAAPPAKFSPEIEAASKIMPPPPPTVDWLGWPVFAVKGTDIDPGFYPGGKTPPVQLVRDDVQIGLRSDGCVVWRERK